MKIFENLIQPQSIEADDAVLRILRLDVTKLTYTNTRMLKQVNENCDLVL